VLNVLGCDFFLTFYSLVYDQGVASDQVPRDHYQLHDDRIRGETAVAGHVYRGTSEKNAKLAQKLGQLQPFIADSHRNARANWHLLGQPDTFLAQGGSRGGARHLLLQTVLVHQEGHEPAEGRAGKLPRAKRR
jgi:hypothetical protein